LALLTNGTYVFLTDHSGVGNPHIEPTTDEYEVELLNDLIRRLIVHYSTIVDCIAEPPLLVQDTLLIESEIPEVIADSTIDDVEEKTGTEEPEEDLVRQPSWKCFPNPTTGMITIESDREIHTVYLCDITGKIVMRHLGHGANRTTLDISNYRRGIYFLSYEYDKDKWMKGRIVLTR